MILDTIVNGQRSQKIEHRESVELSLVKGRCQSSSLEHACRCAGLIPCDENRECELPDSSL